MAHPYLIVVAKTATMLLGGLVTYMSARAYRRTGAPSLRALAIGFGIVTVGGALAGVLDITNTTDLQTSVLTQSLVTALGFGVITYSLYSS